MRISVMLLFTVFLQVSANSLAQKVEVNRSQLTYEQLFDLIEQQTGLRTFSSSNEINLDDKITVKGQAYELDELLKEVVGEAGLAYDLIDDYIVVRPLNAKEKSDLQESKLQQEKITVSGVVTDESGQPIPGANVFIKGTQTGTITDVNGEYSLQVTDPNAILMVSFIGMETQELSIGDKRLINATMRSAVSEMDEVIVTGYQTISKERTTGAFSTINDEDLGKKINADLTKSIEGLTAGVVTDANGNVTIRGVSTFRANSKPLIILDGFMYDGTLKSINPDNVENITVLKDGVAASIYGARATNGVIVVTTKKGKKGEMNISYKGTISTYSKPDFDDLKLASPNDYIDGAIGKFDSFPALYTHYGVDPKPVEAYLLQAIQDPTFSRDDAMAEIDKLRGNNVYNQVEENALRNRFSHQHNIAVSGGGEKNLYNVSLNLFDEKGHEIMSDNSRMIVDIKNTWMPNDRVTFSTAANIVYAKSGSSKTNMYGLVSSYGLQPYQNIVDDHGNPIDVPGYVTKDKVQVYEAHGGLKPWNYNPLQDMRLGTNSSEDFKTRLSANLNVDIIKGLSLSLGGAWTRGSSITEGFLDADAYDMRIGYNDASSASDPNKHYMPEGAMLDESRNIKEDYTLRAQLNFKKSFNDDKHRISALAGHEVSRYQYNGNTIPTKLGYNSTSGDYIFVDNSTFSRRHHPNRNDFLFGTTWNTRIPYVNPGKLIYKDNRFVSWYGNGSYEFDNRFIATGSIRLDLTNFFGTDPEYRYKPTWSVGGTYKLSNEQWFTVDFINRLNLRASYGVNGNIDTSQGPFLILESDGYDQNAQAVANKIASPANDQLRWEKTYTYNVAFDLSMLDSRINLSVDMYKKKSTDLLGPDAVDPTKGVRNLTVNAGEITNKGIEVALNADVVRNADFNYNTNFTLSHNKSNVDEYNLSQPWATQFLMDLYPYTAGYELNAVWGYRGAPLSSTGGAQAYDAEGNIIRVNSVQKKDIVYLGTYTPKLNLAWSNTFNYKNLEASFMFVGSFGAKFREDTFDGRNITNRHVADSWKQPGDENKTIYPKISYYGSGIWYGAADTFVKSADYVKLREVMLSYYLPKSFLNNIGFKRARVYVQARNLLTITRKGVDIDPETHSGKKLALPTPLEFHTGLSFEF